MLPLRKPLQNFLKLHHGFQKTQRHPGPCQQAHSARYQVRAFCCHKQDIRFSFLKVILHKPSTSCCCPCERLRAGTGLQALQSLGLPNWDLLMLHRLPNATYKAGTCQPGLGRTSGQEVCLELEAIGPSHQVTQTRQAASDFS